ncbi:MAG: hypothetical protein WCT16_04065 [Candidatus Buchananbacteria bacterium]
MMENGLKLKINQQALIGLLVGLVVLLVVLGGLVLAFYKFYGAATGNADKNGLPAGRIEEAAGHLDRVVQPADLAKLNAEYVSDFSSITKDFLNQTAVSNDLAVLARSAQDKLLALKVPTEYKAKHLSVILLLGEIGQLAESGNQTTANKKLTELKSVINQ